MRGTITFYNNLKGYGFITVPDGGKQFFFHISNFIASNGEAPVLEGQVHFDVGPAVAVGKKPQALHVQYCHNEGAIVMQPRSVEVADGGTK